MVDPSGHARVHHAMMRHMGPAEVDSALVRIVTDRDVVSLRLVRIDGDVDVLLVLSMRHLPLPRQSRFQGTLESVVATAQEFVGGYHAGRS